MNLGRAEQFCGLETGEGELVLTANRHRELYRAKGAFCIQTVVHNSSRLLSYCCDKDNLGEKGLCQLAGYSLSLREPGMELKAGTGKDPPGRRVRWGLEVLIQVLPE